MEIKCSPEISVLKERHTRQSRITSTAFSVRCHLFGWKEHHCSTCVSWPHVLSLCPPCLQKKKKFLPQREKAAPRRHLLSPLLQLASTWSRKANGAGDASGNYFLPRRNERHPGLPVLNGEQGSSRTRVVSPWTREALSAPWNRPTACCAAWRAHPRVVYR